MKHILQRQKGMSVIGGLLILAMLGCFFIFGVTLFPLYMEYINVKHSMESVIKMEYDRRKTTKQIRRLFLRNAEINNIERFTDRSVKELVSVKRSKNGKRKFLNVKYQATNKLVKNIYIMLDVDESLELTGSTSQ